MMHKKIVAWLCLLLALALPLTALADVGSLAIVQVYQEEADTTRLHVRLEGGVDGKSLSLRAEDIAEATIGTGTVPVISVSSTEDEAFGGMRYVFVLDHAMPINNTRVGQLKDGVHAWIDALNPQDTAAILVSEEEEVRVVADFTADKTVLHAAVDDYGKGVEYPRKNMIYSAIKQAVEMASRADASLPRSSCIVVCSNGADTYQTLVTGEQLAQMLSENSIPLYVAGFAYTAQKEALVGLMNIARNAGGWCEDATPTNDQQTLDLAFDNLRERIMGGYDIVLDCSDGFVFNGATLVSLRLSNPEALVKQTADLYLLKEEKTDKTAVKVTAKPAVADIQPVQQETVSSDESWLEGETVVAGKAIKNSLLLVVAAGAVVLLLVVVLLSRRNKADRVDSGVASALTSDMTTEKVTGMNVAPGVPMAPGSFEIPQPTLDGKTTRVRGGGGATSSTQTLRVRGEGRQIGSFAPSIPAGIEKLTISYTINGQPQQFEMPNPVEITIGRQAEANTLVLQDGSVSARHVKIVCEGSEVVLENISPVYNGSRNRLCVDRQEVEERVTLHNGAHLTIGSVPATVTWTEAGSRSNLTGDLTMRVTPPAMQRGDVTQRVSAPPLEVTYTIEGQQPQSKMLHLAGPVTIGRGEKDTLRIPEGSISEGHLQVKLESGSLVVCNGSSDRGAGKNPFYYKAQPVVDQIAYEEGQDIYAGRVTVKLRLIRQQNN